MKILSEGKRINMLKVFATIAIIAMFHGAVSGRSIDIAPISIPKSSCEQMAKLIGATSKICIPGGYAPDNPSSVS